MLINFFPQGSQGGADGLSVIGGGAPPASGVLNVTLDDVAIVAQGTVPANGALAQTLDDAALAAQGTVPANGALAQTLDDAALAAQGTVPATGALAATLDDAALAAQGTVPATGALAATLDDAALAAAGTVVTPFDPTTLTLSSYQRNYAGIPWAGTASAGSSGTFHEAQSTLANQPPISTKLVNGIAGAQYRRGSVFTGTVNGSNAVQVMETFVSNAAYTISFFVDIQGPAVVQSPAYGDSALFAADAHWVWGITSTAQLRNQPTIAIDGAAQTITRGSGSFITDGFVLGQTVYLAGTAHNDGFVSAVVSAISATVLTFAGGGLVTETAPITSSVSAGPYAFVVMNFTGAFPTVSVAITPGLHWIYVRRLSTTQIQIDIDGVPGTPQALAQHSGASGVAANTNFSNNEINLADFILYERFTSLLTQSTTERDNYKSYLNQKYATAY